MIESLSRHFDCSETERLPVQVGRNLHNQNPDLCSVKNTLYDS